MKLEEQPTGLAADSEQDPIAHKYCNYCYPVIHPGMLALCGWVLEGIELPPDSDICIVCIDLTKTHGDICPRMWRE